MSILEQLNKQICSEKTDLERFKICILTQKLNFLSFIFVLLLIRKFNEKLQDYCTIAIEKDNRINDMISQISDLNEYTKLEYFYSYAVN